MKKILRTDLLLLLAGIVFSITPLYGIGYLCLVAVGAMNLYQSAIFSSFLSRLILSFLLFTSTLMAVGVFTWFIKVPTYPILCVFAFGILLSVIRCKPEKTLRSKVIDMSDVLSMGLALIAPLVVIGSFCLPHPSYAGVYQFVSTGWDNGSHLNMLQNDGQAQGYVYEKSPANKFVNSKDRFGAYPQGWHLATSDVVNGFGAKPFSSSKPLAALVTYFVVYLAWYVIAVYCFSKLAWGITKKTVKNIDNSWFAIAIFSMLNLLFQVVVFYGSLVHGFANYLGCMAYLIIIFAMVYENNTKRSPSTLLTAIIAGVGATLSWLLPLPAIVLVIFLEFFSKKRVALRLTTLKKISWTWLVAILALVVTIVQALIFSHMSGAKGSQLQEGTASGSFPISTMFVSAILCLTLLYWSKIKQINAKASFTIGSFTILAAAVYIDQMFTTFHISYYFKKTIALVFLAGGIYFISAFIAVLYKMKDRYQLSLSATLLMAIGFMCLLLMGSGQDTTSLNYLFQRHSKVTYTTSQAIVSYLSTQDPHRTKLVVIRNLKRSEDSNGYLYSLLSNLNYTCANYVTGSTSLAVQLHSLNHCANKLGPADDIEVITSDKTRQLVNNLSATNLQVVNVP
ncbi:MAG TPA: hypothetical protein VHA52_01650 [Candidatus Babeliaceae bacterium]|nr:hypothetical protein [Candidatus Babeliaceae bacterium]